MKNRISEIRIFLGRHNNSLDTAEARISEFQNKEYKLHKWEYREKKNFKKLSRDSVTSGTIPADLLYMQLKVH